MVRAHQSLCQHMSRVIFTRLAQANRLSNVSIDLRRLQSRILELRGNLLERGLRICTPVGSSLFD